MVDDPAANDKGVAYSAIQLKILVAAGTAMIMVAAVG